MKSIILFVIALMFAMIFVSDSEAAVRRVRGRIGGNARIVIGGGNARIVLRNRGFLRNQNLVIQNQNFRQALVVGSNYGYNQNQNLVLRQTYGYNQNLVVNPGYTQQLRIQQEVVEQPDCPPPQQFRVQQFKVMPPAAEDVQPVPSCQGHCGSTAAFSVGPNRAFYRYH